MSASGAVRGAGAFAEAFRAVVAPRADEIERPATAVQVERPRGAPPAFDIDPPLAIKESGIIYEQRRITVRHVPVGRKGGREYWETAAVSASTPGWVVAFLPGKLEPGEMLRRMGYTVVEPGEVAP